MNKVKLVVTELTTTTDDLLIDSKICRFQETINVIIEKKSDSEMNILEPVRIYANP